MTVATHLRPTICQGWHERPSAPTIDDLSTRRIPIAPGESLDPLFQKDGLNELFTEYFAASTVEMEDALYAARKSDRHALIKVVGEVKVPRLFDIGAKQVVFYGMNDRAKIVGDKWMIAGVYASTTKYAFVNIDMEGNDTQKGIVLGSAKDGQDRNQQPANNVILWHVAIHHVEQQIVKWSDDSRNLWMSEVDLHSNGPSKYVEQFYGGEGSKVNPVSPRNCWMYGVSMRYGNGSELLDWKVNAIGLRATWLDLQEVDLPYSGALAVAIDNDDGGHGEDNNWEIQGLYIAGVGSTEHRIAGAQIGAGGSINCFVIENIGGYGIQALDQAVGPNKTLKLNRGIIRDCQFKTIQRGGSTLTDKSKAVNAMKVIVAADVHTDDGVGNILSAVSGSSDAYDYAFSPLAEFEDSLVDPADAPRLPPYVPPIEEPPGLADVLIPWVTDTTIGTVDRNHDVPIDLPQNFGQAKASKFSSGWQNMNTGQFRQVEWRAAVIGRFGDKPAAPEGARFYVRNCGYWGWNEEDGWNKEFAVELDRPGRGAYLGDPSTPSKDPYVQYSRGAIVFRRESEGVYSAPWNDAARLAHFWASKRYDMSGLAAELATMEIWCDPGLEVFATCGTDYYTAGENNNRAPGPGIGRFLRVSDDPANPTKLAWLTTPAGTVPELDPVLGVTLIDQILAHAAWVKANGAPVDTPLPEPVVPDLPSLPDLPTYPTAPPVGGPVEEPVEPVDYSAELAALAIELVKLNESHERLAEQVKLMKAAWNLLAGYLGDMVEDIEETIVE